MRRIAFLTLILGVAAVGCGGDEPSVPPNPHDYQILPAVELIIPQDSAVALWDFGVWVVRDGVDTIPGEDTGDRRIPRLSYFMEDTDIAVMQGGPPGVDIGGQYGWVRGLKPGTTVLKAVGYGDTVSFPITVVAKPSSAVILRVVSGPAGGLIPVAQRTDTGTFYAYPSHAATSRMEGLILGGASGLDTLYCNICGVKTTSQGGPRIMRLVNFKSLDETKVTVSNASDPYRQRTSQTGSLANTDLAGFLTVLDTSSTPIGIVMEVPGDGKADTAWVKLKLRPIDSIQIRPDSNNFPPTTINQIGTVRRIYPNSDVTAGNVEQSGSLNFITGITYLFAVRALPHPPSTTQVSSLTWLPIRPTGNVTVRRPVLPIINWESALESYLAITPIDVALGAVVAPCAFIGGACPAATRNSNQGGPGNSTVRTQAARDSLVIRCSDTNGNKLPGTLANGQPAGAPILFNGVGNYVNNICPTPQSIPMPGAYCTTASSTDLTSTCTIWVRARTNDQATGKLLSALYPINVRR